MLLKHLSVSTFFCFSILTLCLCSSQAQSQTKENFTHELTQLQSFFEIPGMAVLVQRNDSIIYENYLGVADKSLKVSVDSTTLFPIASLTKIFSGVLMMKLEEEGKVDLDQTISSYLPGMGVPDNLTIKHVISHTSQGEPRKHFYYSYRYGMLTPVIEVTAGLPIEEAFHDYFLSPLQMTNSVALTDSFSVAGKSKKYSPLLLSES